MPNKAAPPTGSTAVEAAVLDRLRHMARIEGARPGEVDHRARDLQHAIESMGSEPIS